jgi:acetyl-CoA C-acetyltransferase
MSQRDAYIIAARRTALGRVGGLHGRRRIEDLAAPVISTALGDCRINPAIVDGLILGNATEVTNTARLVALASGLPEAADATTMDRQCASGLDAIVMACRLIMAGDAEVLVAGGAEALSTAPWRVARPKHLHQLPRFLGYEPVTSDTTDEPQLFEASERLARDLKLLRDALDAVALRSHAAALAAREARRFIGEIVPMKQTPDETRDEQVRDVTIEDLASQAPFSGSGPLTAGNTSPQADGAAVVIVVSPRLWAELGQPKALRFVRAASLGVVSDQEATAAIAATERLKRMENGIDIGALASIETSETSSAQLLAFARRFDIDVNAINRLLPAGIPWRHQGLCWRCGCLPIWCGRPWRALPAAPVGSPRSRPSAGLAPRHCSRPPERPRRV